MREVGKKGSFFSPAYVPPIQHFIFTFANYWLAFGIFSRTVSTVYLEQTLMKTKLVHNMQRALVTYLELKKKKIMSHISTHVHTCVYMYECEHKQRNMHPALWLRLKLVFNFDQILPTVIWSKQIP